MSALIVTAASGPPTHHFSRATLAMAGKKRRAEPEEEEFSEDDSEFDEDEEGEGAPPGVVEEEDDDDELEAEMAALEAIQREKRGGAPLRHVRWHGHDPRGVGRGREVGRCCDGPLASASSRPAGRAGTGGR